MANAPLAPLETEEQLVAQMTTPTPEVEAAVRELGGDILILGIAGKMGPSLGELLLKAGAKRVIGVSRFSNPDSRQDLEDRGIDTVQADLLDETALAGLPDAPYVYQMAGHKFGATGNEPLTWAMNTLLPAQVVSRYRNSRIVYVSSGNVYKYASTDGAGATETDPVEPIGEYAESRLGGERVATHQADRFGTKLVIFRLFYATELRYGIVLDIGQKVSKGEPIDLTMGHVNQLWQGDANGYLARSFPLCESPAQTLNMTGREVISVRSIAESLGEALSRPPVFEGEEAPTALLGDASRLTDVLGEPRIRIDQIIAWVAGWLAGGGRTLGKPTQFESRTGNF